jgi:hypothetical protein
VNIDYRYYIFDKQNTEYQDDNYGIKDLDLDIYLNAFVKIGKRKVWSESPLTFIPGTYVSDQKANYIDYGLAIGLKRGFTSENRFGIDFNIGVSKRYSHIIYERSFLDNSTLEKFDTFGNQWLVHARLNLYYQL